MGSESYKNYIPFDIYCVLIQKISPAATSLHNHILFIWLLSRPYLNRIFLDAELKYLMVFGVVLNKWYGMCTNTMWCLWWLIFLTRLVVSCDLQTFLKLLGIWAWNITIVGKSSLLTYLAWPYSDCGIYVVPACYVVALLFMADIQLQKLRVSQWW